MFNHRRARSLMLTNYRSEERAHCQSWPQASHTKYQLLGDIREHISLVFPINLHTHVPPHSHFQNTRVD